MPKVLLDGGVERQGRELGCREVSPLSEVGLQRPSDPGVSTAMKRIHKPVAIVAIVCGSLVVACGVQSIDSVKNKQLDICKSIRDEQIRADCVVRVNQTLPEVRK